MTFWQVILVLVVAWLSGALFGFGLKEQVQFRGWGVFSALLTRLRPAGSVHRAVAPPRAEDQGLDPATGTSGEQDAVQRRTPFWFADEEGTADPRGTGAEEEPAKPSQSSEPAEPDRPTGDGAGEATAAPSDTPEASAEDTTAGGPAVMASGPRLLRIAEAGPHKSGAAEQAPAAAASRPRRRYDPDAAARQIARWRAHDRRAEKEGVMFWVQIGIVVVLLMGASWGVVYFATQPLR